MTLILEYEGLVLMDYAIKEKRKLLLVVTGTDYLWNMIHVRKSWNGTFRLLITALGYTKVK